MFVFVDIEQSKDLDDAFLIVPDIVKKYGYPVEEHDVETKDGYLLKLYRIPSTSHISNSKMASPVLIMHGFLLSSADFIILGPGKSLAYLLADSGYDVWLGNARGNTYSRYHNHLDPDSTEFWQFSWHEIGVYDIPAMINYILNKTLADKLYFIGYSQGNTVFM